jgi:hypothetical protein
VSQAADSSDADHDSHRAVLFQIMVERLKFWEASKVLDGG